MPTALQIKFANKAQEETSHLGLGGKYRLPWKRGSFRPGSSLDKIYNALGTANPTYGQIGPLIVALPNAKKTKYKKTTNWLKNELRARPLREHISNDIISYHFGISIECSIGGVNNRFKDAEDACGYFVFSEGLDRITNRFRDVSELKYGLARYLEVHANTDVRQMAEGVRRPRARIPTEALKYLGEMYDVNVVIFDYNSQNDSVLKRNMSSGYVGLAINLFGFGAHWLRFVDVSENVDHVKFNAWWTEINRRHNNYLAAQQEAHPIDEFIGNAREYGITTMAQLEAAYLKDSYDGLLEEHKNEEAMCEKLKAAFKV